MGLGVPSKSKSSKAKYDGELLAELKSASFGVSSSHLLMSFKVCSVAKLSASKFDCFTGLGGATTAGAVSTVFGCSLSFFLDGFLSDCDVTLALLPLSTISGSA